MQAPTPPSSDAPDQEWVDYYNKQAIYYDLEATRTDVDTSQTLFTYTNQELELQQQINKEEAEYQIALADTIKSQQDYDSAYSKLQESPPDDGLTETEKAELIQYEKDLAAYNAYMEKRNRDLPRGKELQELGLIPVDATNQEVLVYLDQYEADEKKKQDDVISGILNDPGPSIDLINRHKSLVKAHNQFQIKYRKQILNARYGKTINMTADYPVFQLRQVGSKYEPWGTSRNKNPRDVKIWRSFYEILRPVDDETDWMEHYYENGIWKETGIWNTTSTSSGFGVQQRARPPNTLNSVIFTKSGKFPELPWISEEYTASDTIGAYIPHNRGPSQNIYLKGNWNTKRGFSKCASGYWFYEDIPEEASRCVYMGANMIDNNFSYYPESVGFSYKFNIGAAVKQEQAAAAARTPEQERQFRRCLEDAELFGVSANACFN